MQNRKIEKRIRWVLLSSGGALATILMATGAAAQDRDAASEASPADIVVTGTRIERQGYSALTPTTILNATEIERSGKPNVADLVNELPALSGSASPNTSQPGAGATAGMNLLNLRGLGANRTLVLLNGRRVPPSTVFGTIDINALPTQLLSRVDIVTGGASASYGSDAVAGVVNFVIDTKFKGIKGLLQTGISGHGDAASRKFELSAGSSMFGGRGHIEVAANYSEQDGVDQASSRDWFRSNKFVTDPNDSTRRVVVSGVGMSQATDGGLISSGPLRGTQFLPGGVPAPFNFGTVSGLLSYGGDAEDQARRLQLLPPQEQANVFGRISYDVAPSVTLFGEAYYSRTRARSRSVSYNRFNAITIQRDNAYLDPSIVQRMTGARITSFTMGRTNYDIGAVVADNTNENVNFLVGAEGRIGSNFSWDVFYQNGWNKLDGLLTTNVLVNEYRLATDAVRAPAGNALGVPSGTIVCRSTLTNPTNGCVPINLFGHNSPSAQAIDYVLGVGMRPIKTTLQEVALNIRGEPFNIGSRPVSVAAGFEVRAESYDAGADPISRANNFWLGNFQPSAGKFNSKEAYAEAIVPVLSGLPFLEEMDVNGAIRVTDYSESGTVITWKAGSTIKFSDEYSLRGVYSVDIRAPNLNDLFQGGNTGLVTLNDPVLGASYQIQSVQTGNRNLVPEKSRTWSGGAVWRPAFVNGLQLSVDYYNVKITDAIVTIAPQLLVDQCFAGVATLCSSIDRDPATNRVTKVGVTGQNVQGQTISGLDIEASYRTQLSHIVENWNGSLSFRLLLSRIFDNTVIDLGGRRTQYAGTLSDATALPDWRGLATLGYTNGSFNAALTARYIGGGAYTYLAPVVTNNHVPAVTYLNLALSQKLNEHADIALNIDNLLDQDPPAAPATLGATQALSGVNPTIYDTIGRQFRLSFRFRY